MKQREITHIVWDGDNTIWNWVGYAVPAYEAMCAHLSQLSGASFEETAEAMKVFYSRKGTIEDEGLIQGLREDGFFEGMEGFNETEVIKAVQKTFSKHRYENLSPYPDVIETITDLNSAGLRQVLLTDAPTNQARARLKRFKLTPHFEKIYGMPVADIPRFPEFLKQQKPVPFDAVQKAEKPHTDLELILEMTKAQIAKHVAIIGDNKAKDMELARSYGCLGIHAAYGVSTAEDIAKIQQFAPERVVSRSMQVTNAEASSSSILTAEHPSEVWDYIV